MEERSLMDFMKEEEQESSEPAKLDDEAWEELKRALTEYDYPPCMSGVEYEY